MFSKIKIYSLIFIIGLIAGAAGVFYIKRDVPVKDTGIKVTQLSGEKIEHSKYNFKGSSIKFETQSEGAGKIKTEIPKTLIPEANAWLNKVHSIQAEYISMYYNSSSFQALSVSYYQRLRFIDFVALGGGIIVDPKNLTTWGYKIGTQIWF